MLNAARIYMSKVVCNAAISNSGTIAAVEFQASRGYESESLYVTLLLPGCNLSKSNINTLVTGNKKEIIAKSMPADSGFSAEDYEEEMLEIHGLSSVVMGDAAETIQILFSHVHYTQFS